MKKLLLAAAATAMLAASPAFASSPADDAEWDRSPYPSPSQCHFVTERMLAPNGHVIFERYQVCD
jgi:hypothetical protein